MQFLMPLKYDAGELFAIERKAGSQLFGHVSVQSDSLHLHGLIFFSTSLRRSLHTELITNIDPVTIVAAAARIRMKTIKAPSTICLLFHCCFVRKSIQAHVRAFVPFVLIWCTCLHPPSTRRIGQVNRRIKFNGERLHHRYHSSTTYKQQFHRINIISNQLNSNQRNK